MVSIQNILAEYEVQWVNILHARMVGGGKSLASGMLFVSVSVDKSVVQLISVSKNHKQ